MGKIIPRRIVTFQGIHSIALLCACVESENECEGLLKSFTFCPVWWALGDSNHKELFLPAAVQVEQDVILVRSDVRIIACSET